MAQKNVGFLTYYCWDAPEESVIVAIVDRKEPQVFPDFVAEWFKKEGVVRVIITRWSRNNPSVLVRLGDPAIDVAAECSFKFCASEAVAKEWQQTQSQS